MSKKEKEPFGILLLERGKPKKLFKGWVWNTANNAKITIPLKKNGEPIKLVKQYKAFAGKTAVISCLQAVIKYWPKFDPEIHNVTIVKGHDYPIPGSFVPSAKR